MLTVIEDTSPSRHNTLTAPCDGRPHHLFGKTGHPDNLAATLAEPGLEATKMLSPLNFLMNIPSTLSGSLGFEPPWWNAGGVACLATEHANDRW